MTNTTANAEAEQALLGAIIQGGLPAYHEASESLSEADFTQVQVAAVWRCLGLMDAEGSEVTIETVVRHLKTSGIEKEVGDPFTFLAVTCADKAISVSIHVQDIRKASKFRRIAATGQFLMGAVHDITKEPDSIIAEAEARLAGEEITVLKWVDQRGAVTMLNDELQRRFENRGKLQGVPTGFYEFDTLTDGLQFGEQTLIAARPSMGKTAIGLNICEHAALQQQIPTLFISLEMSVPALMRRLLASMTGVTMGEIRGGTFTESDFKKFTVFGGRVMKSPLFFIPCHSGTDSKRLCSMIRRKVKQHGIKLVVIDYLQRIQGSKKQEKKTYELAEVSGDLSACAKHTGAAFLTLAQLSREAEKEKGRAPRLSDIADSGQIERDADTVALLHRDRSDPNVTPHLIIAKQRDGNCGAIKLGFDGKFCRFTNYSQ